MGKFDKILIVSDIDGTLLSDDKSLSERNIRAAKYFIENGGAFTLASGRNKTSILSVTSQIQINAPSLLLNGAMIYDVDTKTILWEKTADEKALFEVLSKIMEHFPLLGVEIYTSKGMCVVNKNRYTEMHKGRDPKNFFYTSLEDAPKAWYKAILTDEPSTLKEVEKYVVGNDILAGYPMLRTVYTEDIFFEIMPSDVSKGTALSYLMENDARGFKKAYAIGDNFNDFELLEAADVAAVPVSAIDEVKAKADVIVCSNNDGVLGDVVEMIEREIE